MRIIDIVYLSGKLITYQENSYFIHALARDRRSTPTTRTGHGRLRFCSVPSSCYIVLPSQKSSSTRRLQVQHATPPDRVRLNRCSAPLQLLERQATPLLLLYQPLLAAKLTNAGGFGMPLPTSSRAKACAREPSSVGLAWLPRRGVPHSSSVHMPARCAATACATPLAAVGTSWTLTPPCIGASLGARRTHLARAFARRPPPPRPRPHRPAGRGAQSSVRPSTSLALALISSGFASIIDVMKWRIFRSDSSSRLGHGASNERGLAL
jgi:hypothetical protein